MPNPIRFVFGVHLHQPVGNFDSVFEQHLADVYRPLLEKVDERGFLPVVLHLSGPLLEWLETHDSRYLDLLGRLASDGRIELLCAGHVRTGAGRPAAAGSGGADRLDAGGDRPAVRGQRDWAVAH